MKHSTVDVLVAVLTYGGNGGVATCLPTHATWLSKITRAMSHDPRIGKISIRQYGDIPLSMERNRIVKDAKAEGFDVILMLDSDNVPDLYYGRDPEAKPFWSTSFDFLYDRLVKGIPTVVCAPYCGPPPDPVRGGEENVYVFYFSTNEQGAEIRPAIVPYSRDHAATMRGIKPIAAGPTGVILYSTSAFDLMPVRQQNNREILEEYRQGKLSLDRAEELINLESWFFYEYTDPEQTRKASTEDVTNTREIQLAGLVKHKQPIVFCNWDAWAGHYKPKLVGRPTVIPVEAISQVFREAVKANISAGDETLMLDFYDPEIDGKANAEFSGEDSPQTEDSTEVESDSGGERLMYCIEQYRSLTQRREKLRILELSFDDGRDFFEACRLLPNIEPFSMRTNSQEAAINLLAKSPTIRTVKVDEPNGVAEAFQQMPDKDLDILIVHQIVGKAEMNVIRYFASKVKTGGMLVLGAEYHEEFEHIANGGEFGHLIEAAEDGIGYYGIIV